MFDGIPEDRLLNMTDPERRLLNNIKKASTTATRP